jgi:glutamine amidotransferase
MVSPAAESAPLRIAVVDYGAGNLRSVVNALEAIGTRPIVTARPEDLGAAAGIIVPGVGAFGDAIERLRRLDVIPAIEEEVAAGKPYLGICLGMQFMAEWSEEGGHHRGFGWVKGCIRRIRPADRAFKVPHMGWNDVVVHRPGRLLTDLDGAPVFYFVHGYALEVAPDDGEVVTSICWHGCDVVASVEKGNLLGVQFHPEKSQRVGLGVLKNFVALVADWREASCSRSA